MSFQVNPPTSHELIELPKSIRGNGKEGRTFLSSTWCIQNESRRRVSNELCIAIDGVSIALYDMTQPEKLLSFDLSPLSTFECAPVSYLTLAREDVSGKRVFYFASNEGPGLDPTITRLDLEEVPRHGGPLCPVKAGNAFVFPPGSQSPVSFMGSFGADPYKDQSRLLVVHEDATIRCLWGDLSPSWCCDSKSYMLPTVSAQGVVLAAGEVVVEYVEMVDSLTACRGLLASRPDCVSFISSLVTDACSVYGDPIVLVMATRPKNATTFKNSVRTLIVLAISPEPTSTTQHLRLLFTGHLPSSHGTPRFFDFDWFKPENADTLFRGIVPLVVESRVILYDLTGTAPTIFRTLDLGSQHILSALMLNNDVMMVSTTEYVKIYDAVHQSILMNYPIHGSESAAESRKKSKNPNDLKLFSRCNNQAFGISSNKVVALEILPESSTSERANSRMVYSLGLGIAAKEIVREGQYPLPKGLARPRATSYAPLLTQVLEALDQCIRSLDYDGFERLVAAELKIPRSSTLFVSCKPQRAKIVPDQWDKAVPYTGQPDELLVPQWEWPWLQYSGQSNEYIGPHHDMVLYLLATIFSWRWSSSVADHHQKLHLTMAYPNVIHWLVATQSFTPSNVETALQRYDKGVWHRHQLLPKEFVRATMEADPNLALLLKLIISKQLTAITDVIHAIVVLVFSLEYPAKRWKASSGLGQSAEKFPDPFLHEAAEFPYNEVEEIIEACLADLFEELSKHQIPEISQALKSELEGSDIMAILKVLKRELNANYWTATYFETPYFHALRTPPDRTKRDESLVVIAHLLSACIDAIGHHTMCDESNWSLVSALSIEVSFALQVVRESQQIANLFTEFSRYVKSCHEADGVTPIPTAALDQGDNPTDLSLLPLSLRGKSGVSETKVAAGGEVQDRSIRDRQRQLSMRVGKYSHEHIDI